MSWWRKVLGLQNIAAEQKALAALTLMVPTWEQGQPGEVARSFPNAVKHGYRLNELIFACINATANATASVSLKVYSGDDEQPDHPFRALIARPNPYMTEFDFWSATVVMRKLSGHAYWQKRRSRAGVPVQLWPLRPDWVKPVKSSQGVSHYLYGPPGIEPQVIPFEDMIDFNVLDPMDLLYGGQAPVMVAARAVDADNAVTDFLKAFFEKGAMPAGVLEVQTNLSDAMSMDLQRRWGERYGGWKNWMSPAVLHSGAKYQRIGLTFEELGFGVLDQRAEARVCMVMGIPPIIVGTTIGLERGTYSNYEQARKAWWEDHLFPDFQHLKDELELSLLSEFGGAATIDWDFSKVPALQEQQKDLRDAAFKSWTAGAITKNEYRAALGQPPVKNGEVFRIGAGITEVPVGQIAEPKPTPALPAATEEAPPEDGEPASDAKALPGPSETHAAVVAENAPDDAKRRKRERELEEKLIAHYDGFLERVKREARGI